MYAQLHKAGELVARDVANVNGVCLNMEGRRRLQGFDVSPHLQQAMSAHAYSKLRLSCLVRRSQAEIVQWAHHDVEHQKRATSSMLP